MFKCVTLKFNHEKLFKKFADPQNFQPLKYSAMYVMCTAC